MARYFFHIINGHGRLQDDEGTELPSPEKARSHALDGIRSMIAEEARTGRIDLSGRIEVTDEQGADQFDVRYRDAISVIGADG